MERIPPLPLYTLTARLCWAPFTATLREMGLGVTVRVVELPPPTTMLTGTAADCEPT